LVGGNGPHEGNVYARNPITGIFGPVCDDAWDIRSVRTFLMNYRKSSNVHPKVYNDLMEPENKWNTIKTYHYSKTLW